MQESTPFPASFNGGEGFILYAWALGSITALGVIMAMICGWMARDIWRDRFLSHPKLPVTSFRLIILLCSFTSFARAFPEALYLFLWNEVRDDQWIIILTIKRIADGLAILPGALWAILLALSYPSIVNALRASSAGVTMDLLSPWPRLARPALALIMAFVIAFLVAISKLYLGVAGGAH